MKLTIRPLQNLVNRLKRRRHSKAPKTQSKLEAGRYLPWLRLIGLVLLVVLILYKGVYPFALSFIQLDLRSTPIAGSFNDYKWNGEGRVMILVVGLDQTDAEHVFVDALSLVQLSDDEQNKVGIIGINPDLQVYFGRDSATLRTIYNSDFAEGLEVQYLLKGVESIIGTRVDKYVLLDEAGFEEIFSHMPEVPIALEQNLFDNDAINGAKAGITLYEGDQRLDPALFLPYLAADVDGKDSQIFRSGLFIKESLRNLDSLEMFFALPSILPEVSEAVSTNIDLREAIDMMLLLQGIRSDQIKVAYTKSSSTVLTGRNGIYEVRTSVPERIDADLESILLDSRNVAEQASVEILNGSGVFGLASSRARRVNNSGVRVINVGNSFDNYEYTTIYVSDREKYPNSLKTIEHIFSDNVVYAKESYKYKHIGDIVVIIGEKYE